MRVVHISKFDWQKSLSLVLRTNDLGPVNDHSSTVLGVILKVEINTLILV